MAVDAQSESDDRSLEKAAAPPAQPAASTMCEQFKEEGNKFFALGDYAKAVNAYNKAIKQDPENGVLYSNRAAAFIQLGKETKAIKDADQAIALKPEWAKGYFRKGAALVALRRWDEAVDVLKKAQEIEPKSKEILTLLRDTMRNKSSEGSEKKRDDSKGLKLVPSDKCSEAKGDGSAAVKGVPLGFSEAVVEQFVRQSLSSVMAQYLTQGSLKSIVYVQPSTQGEEVLMIGIEAGFDSPQANEQCVSFLRGHFADSKSLAALILAEKKSIAFPQVWKEKPSSKWKWKDSEQGIFMQLDAFSVGAVACTTERKIWFIPTTCEGGSAKPQEPVELDINLFAIMPPLLRSPSS